MQTQNGSQTYREIYGQADSIVAVNASLPAVRTVLDAAFAERYDELIFTGCGTSFYLAQSAAFAFAGCCDTPARAVPCSELFYFPEAYTGCGRKVLVLPVTRKSYTTEVRMAIDRVRAVPGVKTLAITCDPQSREYNDYMLLSPGAAEKSVVMTRSFTSMLYLSVIMALYVGGRTEALSRMVDIYPQLTEKMLRQADAAARKIIAEHPGLNLYVTLGQGVNYGVANECMNKIKEMGIANSEAYHSLEYRHGPMSLVDQNTLIVLLLNDTGCEYDRKLMEQMKGYGAVTLAVGEKADAFTNCCDYRVAYNDGLTNLQYAAAAGFIGQFIGYYIAQAKGLDADAPRHLSQAIVL